MANMAGSFPSLVIVVRRLLRLIARTALTVRPDKRYDPARQSQCNRTYQTRAMSANQIKLCERVIDWTHGTFPPVARTA